MTAKPKKQRRIKVFATFDGYGEVFDSYNEINTQSVELSGIHSPDCDSLDDNYSFVKRKLWAELDPSVGDEVCFEAKLEFKKGNAVLSHYTHVKKASDDNSDNVKVKTAIKNPDPRSKYQSLIIDQLMGLTGQHNLYAPLGPSDGKTTLAKRFIVKWAKEPLLNTEKNFVAYLTNTNKEFREVIDDLKKSLRKVNTPYVILSPKSKKDTLNDGYKRKGIRSIASKFLKPTESTELKDLITMERAKLANNKEVNVKNIIKLLADKLYMRGKRGISKSLTVSEIAYFEEHLPDIYFFLTEEDRDKFFKGKRVIYISNQDVYHTECRSSTRYAQISGRIATTFIDEAHRTYEKYPQLGNYPQGKGDSTQLSKSMSNFLKELKYYVEEKKLSPNIMSVIRRLQKNPIKSISNPEYYEKSVMDVFDRALDIDLINYYVSNQYKLWNGEVLLDEKKLKERKIPLPYTVLFTNKVKTEDDPNYLKNMFIRDSELEFRPDVDAKYSQVQLQDLLRFLLISPHDILRKWRDKTSEIFIKTGRNDWDVEQVLKRPLSALMSVLFGYGEMSHMYDLSRSSSKKITISHLTKKDTLNDGDYYAYDFPITLNLLMQTNMHEIYGDVIVQLTGTPDENGQGNLRLLSGNEETTLTNLLDDDSFYEVRDEYQKYHNERFAARSQNSKSSHFASLGVHKHHNQDPQLARDGLNTIARYMTEESKTVAWLMFNSSASLGRMSSIIKTNGHNLIEYQKDNQDSEIINQIEKQLKENPKQLIFIVSTKDKGEAANIVWNGRNGQMVDVDVFAFMDVPTHNYSSSSDLVNNFNLSKGDRIGRTLKAMRLVKEATNANGKINEAVDYTMRLSGCNDKKVFAYKNKSDLISQNLLRFFRLPTDNSKKIFFCYDQHVPYIDYVVKNKITAPMRIIGQMLFNIEKTDKTPSWNNLDIFSTIKTTLFDVFDEEKDIEQIIDELGMMNTVNSLCEQYEINFDSSIKSFDTLLNRMRDLDAFYYLFDLFHYELSTNKNNNTPKNLKDVILRLGNYVQYPNELNSHTKGFDFEDACFKEFSKEGCIKSKQLIEMILSKNPNQPIKPLLRMLFESADLFKVDSSRKVLVFINLKSILKNEFELTEESRDKWIEEAAFKTDIMIDTYQMLFDKEPESGQLVYQYIYETDESEHLISKNNKPVDKNNLRIEFRGDK